MKIIPITVALTLVASISMAQTKVDSLKTRADTTQYSPAMHLTGRAWTPDSLLMLDTTAPGASTFSLTASSSNAIYSAITSSNYSKWPVTFHYSKGVIFWCSMPNQKTGKITLHLKRSQFRWLNDTTAIISPYKKPTKPVKKHFRRLADGSFYLKELKPGETAILTIPLIIKK